MRNLLLWGLIIGFILSNDIRGAQNSVVRVIDSQRFEWQIDPPEISEIKLTNTGISYSGWNMTINGLGYEIPVLSKLVYTASGPPEIEIDQGEYLSLIPPNDLHTVIERAKGISKTVLPEPESSQEVVTLKMISAADDHQLWAINIAGAIFDEQNHRWKIPEYLIIHINSKFSEATIFADNDLYLNQYLSPGMNEINAAQTGYGQGKIKLLTLVDGIYRIYFDSLNIEESYPGVTIQSRSIRLMHKGEEQTIYVGDGGDETFDSGDYFDFIGTQNYFTGNTQYFDPFSDINVYWLDWGGSDGLRFIEESGALNLPDPVRPVSFWDVIHVEQDSIFDRLGRVDTNLPTIARDHYFWNSVNSGHTEEVSFFLANPFRGSSENVSISIGLHGLTYSADTGEEAGHSLFAFLNDNSIGEGSWTQQEEYTLVSPAALNLSHNILNHGNNTLAVFVPVSTEPGKYDRIVLNWIEIGYEHLLRAQDNALRFRKSYINPSSTLEYEVKGFSSHDLVLYKEGLTKITGYSIRENWDSGVQKFSLIFQDEATDATPDYWVTSVDNLLQPIKIIPDTLASLRDLDGDFIIITIPEFMEGLDDYIDFKIEDGWNPVAVSIADIYDEFNYGINSPFAIKAFLKYARNHWPSTPEYVLMIGDATADPQQSKRDTRFKNIPTFYMQTYGWGSAEADYWYTLVNGDDYIPDLNIGRLPCSDSDDLERSLNKLIQYSAGSNYGSWQNAIITIAGFESTFKTQSESLLQTNVPKSFMPSRIFIDRDSEGQIFWGDTDSLVAQWNEGKLLINFLGHGGGAVWADRSLFVRDDIQYLDEDTSPAFVTSMTCFTASFAQVRGLGEVVLTESPTGAIGWFGSSGVGWVMNDFLMIQPLLRRLLEEHKPVGELINLARMEYYLTNSGYDYLKPSMLFQYNYLGDPTTRLSLPESGNLLTSQKSIYSQTDQIELFYTGAEMGTIKLLPMNAEGHPWWSAPKSYETIPEQHFLFNQESNAPMGESRTIVTLDRGLNTTAINGYIPYSISSDWFEHNPPTAGELENGAAINLQVKYNSENTIADSMIVVFTGANTGSYNLIRVGEWWSLPDSIRLTSGSYPTYYSFSAYHFGTFLQKSATFRLYLPADISLTLNGVAESTSGYLCGWKYDYTLQGLSQGYATLSHHETALGYEQNLIENILVQEGHNFFFVPSYFGNGTVDINAFLQLDDDMNPEDDSLTAHIDPAYYQIIPGLGLSFDGQTSDTIPLWSSGYLYSASNDTGWVRIMSYSEVIEALDGVMVYQDSIAYLVETYKSDLGINIVSPRPLFLKKPELAGWYMLKHSGQEYKIPGSGYVAMGIKQNSTPPSVSMMIQGQLFFDGDYLLKNSHLNILAEDENGFSWDDQDVKVMVDEIPVEISFGDTTKTCRIISVTTQLDLSLGEHQISYQISDALGNWSDPAIVTAVVASEAKILDYGNFPNPFEGETTIIYELTQPLSDVVIEIFTLSGYKLHRIDTFNARVSIPLGAIGYHEVPWNGRDKFTDFVANGVYFYRIRGKLDDKELLGPIGKMVKNR